MYWFVVATTITARCTGTIVMVRCCSWHHCTMLVPLPSHCCFYNRHHHKMIVASVACWTKWIVHCCSHRSLHQCCHQGHCCFYNCHHWRLIVVCLIIRYWLFSQLHSASLLIAPSPLLFLQPMLLLDELLLLLLLQQQISLMAQLLYHCCSHRFIASDASQPKRLSQSPFSVLAPSPRPPLFLQLLLLQLNPQ